MFGTEYELFTKKRFYSILENPAPTASELIEQTKSELDNHVAGAPEFEDITR